jgi:transcriptional regulator with XRE-family HTH domain
MEKSSGNISKIREIANERGMTLAFISKKLGKSSGYLSEISGRNADVPSQYLPAIAEILGTSAEYINGRVESPDKGKMDITTTVEYGKFQFQRFYDLSKEAGVKQAHLYTMVGMSPKAGSNLRKTKKVKPEILEVWARELHTSAAYLNGETDDPAAPEEQEAAQQRAGRKMLYRHRQQPEADAGRGGRPPWARAGALSIRMVLHTRHALRSHGTA